MGRMSCSGEVFRLNSTGHFFQNSNYCATFFSLLKMKTIRKAQIALMLVYEPDSADGGPVPLARVSDGQLIAAVAEAAVSAAEERAQKISRRDEFLGEIERAEVRRLRELLSLLLPGFRMPKQFSESSPAVM
jgi:hypothetical protein